MSQPWPFLYASDNIHTLDNKFTDKKKKKTRLFHIMAIKGQDIQQNTFTDAR